MHQQKPRVLRMLLDEPPSDFNGPLPKRLAPVRRRTGRLLGQAAGQFDGQVGPLDVGLLGTGQSIRAVFFCQLVMPPLAKPGEEPLVGGLVVSSALVDDFETIEVFDVTTTGTIDQVVALVTRPDGQVISQPLPKVGQRYLDRSYGLCAQAGDYAVAVYAIDTEGNTSLPVLPPTSLTRASACTEFMFVSGFE